MDVEAAACSLQPGAGGGEGGGVCLFVIMKFASWELKTLKPPVENGNMAVRKMQDGAFAFCWLVYMRNDT